MLATSWPTDALRELDRLQLYCSSLEEQLDKVYQAHDLCKSHLLSNGIVVEYSVQRDKWLLRHYSPTFGAWSYLKGQRWVLELNNEDVGFASLEEAVEVGNKQW